MPIGKERERSNYEREREVEVSAVERKILKRLEEGRHAPLLYAKVRNNKQWLVAMIDSGAEVNVVGKELLSKIQYERLVDHPLGLTGCGGRSWASQWVKVPVAFSNGLRVDIIAIVGVEFGTALIFGAPFLHANKVGIEYDGCYLSTKAGPVQCEMGLELRRSNDTATVGAIARESLAAADESTLEEMLARAQLQAEEKAALRELLVEYGDLWVGNPRGETSVLQHEIKLTTTRPIREKPRRFTPEQLKVIDEEVEKMLKDKVIRPSCSQYASEPHLVMKKTNDWRFCIDFRRLNDVTLSDEWPLPRIQDLIRSVRNSTHFVGLDLRSGYWQISMHPQSIPYTAFRTRSGLYEFLVMPFGLKTAPATFSRLMDIVVGDLFWKGVCVYLDDVLVHGGSFESTLSLLREVFERLRAARLTLAMNKCFLFPEKLTYLGFVIQDGVLKPNLDRVDVLRRVKAPENVTGVRSLLGCLGYFRQFIPDFAQISEPLTNLLKKRAVFNWTEECEKAKKKLLDSLIEATLSNPLDGEQLKLETDASATAIGGALYCRAGEKDAWRPVEFLSKKLNPTQRNWPAHEREAYAIVHCLQKFECYLKGKKFDVYTDNASLQWMQTTRNGKVARWAAVLSEFQMRVIYRPGNTNLCADFLSRYIDHSADHVIPDRAFVHTITTEIPTIEAIVEAQKTQPPPKARGYVHKDGVVYHCNRIWVPPKQRAGLIEQYHNLSMFHHPGATRMATAIRKVFSWAGIYADILRYNKSCLGCQRIRPGTEALQGVLTPHPIGGPFERVYMDIYVVSIEGKPANILSIIDGHTRWVESRIIPDRSAATVASVFVKEWICKYGCPLQLIVDHERSFVGDLMRQVCETLGVTRLPTTVGHPDANAPIESFHRVLTKGLQRYLVAEKRQLPIEEVLQLILFGYRCSFHSVIKETPAYVTLGIDPRLGAGSLTTRCLPQHQHRVDVLNAVREDIMFKAFLRSIQQYEKTQPYRRTEPLEVGELVLLPIDRSEAAYHAIRKGGAKIQPKFTMPYRVVKVFNQGRSATCKNLCVVSPKCNMYREASIQDLRRVSPPLTDFQREEWDAILHNYYAGYALEEAHIEKLIKVFWEEIRSDPTSKEGTLRKRPRQGFGGATM